MTSSNPIEAPADLLARLIGIDYANPDLPAGGAGEADIADACATWLAGHGFEIHRLEQQAGRPSIVAIARATGGGRSLLLLGRSHGLDTAA
jgi:acetylornithine deacetylase